MPNETPRHILESVPVPIGASERDIRKACERAIERGVWIRLKLEVADAELCGNEWEDDAPIWLDGEEPKVERAGPPHDPG